MNSKMKFRWLDDEENEDDYYFEINFESNYHLNGFMKNCGLR